MSEFRQDIVNKNWVLIAGGRAKRPSDFQEQATTLPNLSPVEEKCDFCPGNENKTLNEISRYPAKGDWLVRVVPNKYEAVGHVIGKRRGDFYLSRPGIGDHEVVITRYHNQPTALQDVGLIDLTLRAYIDRINDLRDHDEVRYVHILQNYGVQAGASIAHPHSQIFAIPFLPDRLQDELIGTRNYFVSQGACVYCEIILHELKANERIVIDTPEFLVIAPYASKLAFAIEVIPKTHRSSFQDITISERKALAQVLKDVFSRLYDRMKNPAYNYYIHTLPFSGVTESKTHDDSKSYHWHIAVLPRVNVWAGFELGTEVYVNVMPPETAAKFFH